MLFVFEGMDGSGKSTLMRVVENKLRSLGQEVCHTRRPCYDYTLALTYRGDITNAAKFHLLIADAVEQLNRVGEILNPAKVVLCDRWIHSQFVYQAHPNFNTLCASKLPSKDLRHIVYTEYGHSFEFIDNLLRLPHTVFYLKTSYDTIRSRIVSRPDQMTAFDTQIVEDRSFGENLILTYENFMTKAASNVVTLDAELSTADMVDQVVAKIIQLTYKPTLTEENQ